VFYVSLKGTYLTRLAFETRRDAVDEDEEDPYGPAGSTDRPYAFDNGDGDDDVIMMGGPSRTAPRSDQNRSRAPADDLERWHDGRPVLTGFSLDPLGVPPDKW
jgi:G patch domain-containing protein 1